MRLSNIVGLTLLCLNSPVAAQDGTCWGVDNKPWTGNKKCPGSSACCGTDATCMPNRLCKNPGAPKDEFVRGPCAIAPYNKSKCAAICVYVAGTEESNGRFPRVKKCDDGSFCCDNDSECCKAGRGLFLSDEGDIIDDPSQTTASPSTSTKSESEQGTQTSKPAKTTSDGPQSSTDIAAEATESADTSSSSSDNQGVKIGLGVGIPVAAIVAGLGAWFFFRNRRRQTGEGPEKIPELGGRAKTPEFQPPTSPQELPS
ncbi:hypothetical protein FDECE_5684 [Fusarium decemcellulare]|nr:hypothetical protein FDECE_5684 [Fusarium decemcellulare]